MSVLIASTNHNVQYTGNYPLANFRNNAIASVIVLNVTTIIWTTVNFQKLFFFQPIRISFTCHTKAHTAVRLNPIGDFLIIATHLGTQTSPNISQKPEMEHPRWMWRSRFSVPCMWEKATLALNLARCIFVLSLGQNKRRKYKSQMFPRAADPTDVRGSC